MSTCTTTPRQLCAAELEALLDFHTPPAAEMADLLDVRHVVALLEIFRACIVPARGGFIAWTNDHEPPLPAGFDALLWRRRRDIGRYLRRRRDPSPATDPRDLRIVAEVARRLAEAENDAPGCPRNCAETLA